MKKLYMATLLAIVATTFAVSSAVASMLGVTNNTGCNVEVHQLGNAYGSNLSNAIIGVGPSGSSSISGIVVGSPGEYINFEVTAVDSTDNRFVVGYAKVTGTAGGKFTWTWSASNPTMVLGAIAADTFGNVALTITTPSTGTVCKPSTQPPRPSTQPSL